MHCIVLVLLCFASFLNFAWIYFGPLLFLHIGESNGFVLQLNTLMWWMQWSKNHADHLKLMGMQQHQIPWSDSRKRLSHS